MNHQRRWERPVECKGRNCCVGGREDYAKNFEKLDRRTNSKEGLVLESVSGFYCGLTVVLIVA